MSFDNNIHKLRPFSRGVSIIGIGITPFMLTMDNPDTKGLTEGEMFGHAAISAMKDAGITPNDIDMYIHGQAGPIFQSDAGTPNMSVANWFGMKGRASVHHSQACATGYVALEEACTFVASGVYDVVLSGTCDMSYSIVKEGTPNFIRRHCTEEIFAGILENFKPMDYPRWSHAVQPMLTESWLDDYVKEYHLEDRIDEMLCTLSVNSNEMACKNPNSMTHDTYDSTAKMLGMDNAMDYLKSRFNPKMGKYLRVSHFEQRCDGAGAVIVCPTEMAHRFTDHPIEVLGVGHSCVACGTPQNERHATRLAYNQVKELTGLTGKDMDLFMTNDFFQTSQFLSAEECEYIPRGAAYEYIMEKRMTNEGDRPVQTNGGRCCYGHAHGTSGLHDVYEAVMQMRGLMGETQVKHDVNYAMLRGFGGGQNVLNIILKNNR